MRDHWQRFQNLWRVEHDRATHNQKRWRRIFQSVSANFLGKAVSSLCSLAQVPIALTHLGPEAFGLWMTLTSAVSLLNFADLGMGVGMQNLISTAYGKDDPLKVRQIFFTGLALLSAIAGLLLLLMFPLYHAVDWAGFFKIRDAALIPKTPLALAVIYAAFCLGLPLNTLQRLATGLQLGWMVAATQTAGSILSLALVACAAFLKLDVIAFLILAVLPPLLANLLLSIGLKSHLRPDFSGHPRLDFLLVKPLLGSGTLFLIPQIAASLLFAAPTIAISSVLGVNAVTPYNLAQRILGLIGQLHSMTLGPLWPAYAEAHSRGDVEWIRKNFRRSLLFTLAVLPVPCLAFTFFGGDLIRFWSSYPGKFSLTFLGLMSLWLALTALGSACAILLNGIGKLTGQAIYGPLSVLAIVISLPPLISSFGIIGAPLALIACYGTLNLPWIFGECLLSLKRLSSEPGPTGTTLHQ